jgi:hypothetical protein
MALSILDGNQSATTLSTILSSGQHITAHTVVSLGTQAITDMRSAVSGSVVSVSSLPAISGTVTANVSNINLDEDGNLLVALQQPNNPYTQPISGTVTANAGNFAYAQNEDTLVVDKGVLIGWRDDGTGEFRNVSNAQPLPISGTVTADAGSGFPGVIYSGILQYIDAEGPIPVSISSVTVGNSVTIGSLPAISGTVTANTFAVQGTAVTTSNFTSTTASTVLASFNATREVLTIFNEGAGNLHICAGATCTTIAYQVRLSSGDYYEVPNHQTSLTHSAVFATAGTARVTQVS